MHGLQHLIYPIMYRTLSDCAMKQPEQEQKVEEEEEHEAQPKRQADEADGCGRCTYIYADQVSTLNEAYVCI